MSNGARLGAVIVVVAVASIGLYFAFMTPSGGTSADPAAPVDPLKSPEAIGGEVAAGDQLGAPPPEAFGPGSGTVGGAKTDAAGSMAAGSTAPGSTAPGATAPGTVAVKGAETGAVAAGVGAAAAGGTKSAGGVVPTGAGSGSAAPVALTPTPPAKSTTSAAAPAGAEYTVKSGDTLEAIARAQLGDGQKWRAIVEMNPGLDPKALKVGQKLKMPAGGTATAKESSAPTSGAANSATNTYTVQKGDTLVAIARKFYGGDSDWKRILDANSSVLKGDAAALRPGMKLTIPAKR
jgi:nucleoid-associated protein YgaU